MDIDQVWAQAYTLYKKGCIYWLDKDDQVELSEYNEQFEVQSNEYEVLVTYMQPPDEGELPEADLTNAEILVHLQEKVSIKISPKKLGEALRKANFPGTRNSETTAVPGFTALSTPMKLIYTPVDNRRFPAAAKSRKNRNFKKFTRI